MEPIEQNLTSPTPITNANNQKSDKGLKIVVAIACVLAVCGVAFGIFELLQNSKKDSQISDLKAKVENIQTPAQEIPGTNLEPISGEPASNLSFKNSIILSEGANVFSVQFVSDNHYTNRRSIRISISDGAISSCTVVEPSASGSGTVSAGDCQVSGLSGKISMVSKMGSTQMTWPYIAFLLEDGSVEYISATDLTDNFSATVKGKLNFGEKSPVINIIDSVAATRTDQEAGGYQTTVFCHFDGSYTFFDDSLLAES